MTKIYNDKCGSWYGSDVYLTLSQQKFNGKSAINYFKNLSNYGWSNNSICAILGNMCFESSLNPQLQQRGGSGYGLVQWTPKSNLTSRAKAIKQGFWVNDIVKEEMLAQALFINNRGQGQLVPKDDVKKILGHSPDLCDAVALAVYAMNHGEQMPEYSAKKATDIANK